MSPDTRELLYGNLGLMVLKTFDVLGPLHGYRLARRIEQISGNQLVLNQGTLFIPRCSSSNRRAGFTSKWGVSDSGRRVKICALTRAGRRQLRAEEAGWEHAAGLSRAS